MVFSASSASLRFKDFSVTPQSTRLQQGGAEAVPDWPKVAFLAKIINLVQRSKELPAVLPVSLSDSQATLQKGWLMVKLPPSNLF